MPSPRPYPCTPAELTALLYHLGGDVFVLPIATSTEMVQLGTLASLPAWGVSDTAAATLKLGRRLARGGQLGLLLGIDPVSEHWLLAVSVHPVRLTVLAQGDRDALPLTRLLRAAQVARATPLEQAIALADALDVDAAGRRTFRLLHQLLDRGISMLPSSIPHDERHTWVLTQITRLLFLRFVESEGWLAGNPRFLAEAFDRCLGARRDPTRHLLHPLFFGTLNRERERRSRFALRFGDVPFLNGGLFEPHPVERRHRVQLPVEFWRDAFADLVDRVDVTLDRDSEGGRVTPELLGRVFEGAMHPLERKQEGAFFTPPVLVDAILRETLACHLAPRLRRSESSVRRALDDPDAPMRRLLLDITILDPAVGSGAFLVGALALLHGPGCRSVTRVRHLVTRRLYGVDQHPGAVRICELRLWLEVLRSMRGLGPRAIPPLPNLDATIRAGNALIDPMAEDAVSVTIARRIALQQRELQGAHGIEKRRAMAAARGTEREALADALRMREARLERKITEMMSHARAPTLFNERARMPASDRVTLARLRRERLETRRERRRLLRDAAGGPFSAAIAFAPTLVRRGGFDLVVGNPPWVRAEALPASMRNALAERYQWWRGSGGGWQHLPDLSIAFVERGFRMLAPGGTMSFLLPAKVATAAYAGAARSALLERSTIHRVADLGHDDRAGFEATTYPLALIASRRRPPPGHRVRLGLDSDADAQAQSAWTASGAWMTASPRMQRIAARLAHEHPRLDEQVRAQLGVKTGANAAFLDPPVGLHEWCRPALRGRDLRPFRAIAGAMLLWIADDRGVPLKRAPAAVLRHLAAFEGQLQRRTDQHSGPAWQLFRTRAATAAHRVVWRDLAPQLQAAVIRQHDVVPLNSCYVAAVSSAAIAESLTAWLNSGPVRALARLTAEPAAGGCARFGARAVGMVPLPSAALGNAVLAAFTHAADDHDVQGALDVCVADMLGLTPAECELLGALASNRR